MRRCAWLLGFAPLLLSAAAERSGTVGDLARRTVEIRKDGPVVASAGKAMENYRRFLELQNTDAKMRAEAMRRLGDLHLESGELERMASEVTLLDQQGAEAIKLYATLLRAYPDYPRNDQVLYQLARAYETTAQPEQALATLERIVQGYPSTRDIGEVQFRRGELLFSAKRYVDAEAAYQAVIGRGASGSAFFEQGLYKHGWSLFKQSLSEESLPSFAHLLDRKLLDGRGATRELEALTRADRELVDDTLRVVSIAFSYLDGAGTVDRFFASREQVPYAWLIYARLGDLYVEKQRYQDAATTYRAFVARDPVHERAPGLSMQAIQAYQKGGFGQLVVEGKMEFASAYGFNAPFWRGRERANYPQVVAELKTNLKDLAQHWHATAQKSKKIDDYRSAARWYRDYLASFPSDPDSADTNYLLADALFESRQYPEAIAEYERTAYDYAENLRSQAAAYAALVAYQKHEELLPATEKSAWHARSVESALRFADRFPLHPESAGVQVRAAEDLYKANDLVRAMRTAEAILARNPTVDRAKQRIAHALIGQSQFNLSAFDVAESAFVRALAVADGGSPEYADITERLAAAVYKQGEAKRTAGDLAGAADDFLRVARVATASKIVVTAQYDAAAALVSTQQWERAIPVLENYRRDYPKTEYARDITRNLAVAYTQAGRSAAAAAEFERIVAAPGTEPEELREALEQAAALHEKSGNTLRTVALYEQLVQRFPTPVSEAVETRARLAELAAARGDSARRRHWQNELVKADALAGAERSDRTRYLAAVARLALAEPARDAFRAIKIKLPIKTSLAAKRKALDAALANYKAVAGYEIAETTTQATFETAELYRTLASDLLASERPKKLSDEEREQYDGLLEEQAYPFEEQAIAVHELNTQRAPQGVYDTAVQKSFEALAKLKPGRYGKSELSEENYADPSVQAAALARRSGKLEEAVLELRTQVALDGANAPAWSELGIALRAQGQFGEARTAYEQALNAKPEYAPAWRNLAVLHDLYLNDTVAAYAAMTRYQQLSGEERPVNGWLADLRQRGGAPAAAPAAAPVEAAADSGSADAGAPAPAGGTW